MSALVYACPLFRAPWCIPPTVGMKKKNEKHMRTEPTGTTPKSRTLNGQTLVDAVHEALANRPETFAMPAVGAYLGVHPQTARDWVRKGILPLPAIKVGRTVRWSRAQLEKFVSEGVTK